MTRISLIIVFLCGFNFLSNGEVETIDLTSKKWRFRQIGTEQWHEAHLPSSIHMDLFKNGLIADPYQDNNEQKQAWIEKTDWEYELNFLLSSSILNHQKLDLNFEGLDTYATLFLNGNELGKANNMFRSWQYEVANLLQEGQNTLRIVFYSPLNKNASEVAKYPVSLPSGNETVDLRVSPFTRKAAYHFGWDWGPRFVVVGVWKSITLKAWNEVRFLNASCETAEIKGTKAQMHLEVEVNSRLAKGHYSLDFNDSIYPIRLQAGSNKIHINFEIENPKLWWPNGWGEAFIYCMPIKLKANRTLVEMHTLKFGIRTIVLNTESDTTGKAFNFIVNDRPIFVKGANYVPQDMFLERVDEEKYIDIILKAKEANMNMLRVWGGGIYEKDIFYDLCDEHGIMVWQDFMFANSLYPSSHNFKTNISHEIIQNINRLKRHPCIALWCGNNEIEVAWGNWGWQKQFNYSYEDSVALWNNQLQISHHLIPSLLSQLSPTSNYTTTTPLSNWGKAENFNHSTMHYWGVWHGREPFKNFETNVGRFMVEYGFQSFPNFDLLNDVIHDTSMTLNSEVMINRQKSYIGNGLIKEHAERWFGAAGNFEQFVENSQKTQALAMQIAIANHRINSPHCMGTLFWQFNDCWQGPSWSVLNYDGSEKIAYETAQTWYADIVAYPKLVDGKLEVWINSTRLDNFTGELIITLEGEKEKIKVSDLKTNEVLKLKCDLAFTSNSELKLQIKENHKIIWRTNLTTFLLP